MNFKLTGFIFGNLDEDLNNVNISLLFIDFLIDIHTYKIDAI